ncbi:MAG TPA: hypothetical protein DGG22_07775 [Ruminococcaceae bacterium]|nr:hypothetical protein [Oscillospiraceae bacterium]
MKKSTKLLSVILAVVMIFSTMSVMAFAAKTKYQTSDNLTALDAYSPDGAVTRLSTEERMSVVFDFLDVTLAAANINMGDVINKAGLHLVIDLRSVNALCGTIDSAQALLNNGLVKLVKSLLGIVKDANLKNWPSGMTRENHAQLDIVNGIATLLNDNAGLVKKVINDGKLDVGIIGNFVDISGVNKYLSDLPGMLKGLVYPVFARVDDDMTLINTYSTTTENPDTLIKKVLINAMSKPQSYTSYKEDASGNCISNHIALPTSAEAGLRDYYVKGSDSKGAYIEVFEYDTAKKTYISQDEKYYKTEETDMEGKGTGVYVYANAAGENVKYYVKDSYFLPSLATSGKVSEIFNLDSNTLVSALYQVAPYVFKDLAPVVLNGSVKMLLAQWFGAEKTELFGGKASEATAVLAKLPSDVKAFYSKAAGAYNWEWSDFTIGSDGNGYYRLVSKDGLTETWLKFDMSTANSFAKLINWNYTISGDFVDEFMPTAANDGSVTASAAGYTTVLASLNDFVGKAIDTILSDTAKAAINWTKGDNTKLIPNLRKALQYVAAYNPEYLFGTGYETVYAGYYDTVVDKSASDQDVVTALGAIGVKALMPQIILPSAAELKGQNVTALLACVIRELATQFVPTYNYDALIYADYNSKTLVKGKNSGYWLDVIFTMGTDIGMKYLSKLADLGSDKAGGYKFAASKTYKLADFEKNTRAWEDTIDWIIDWALTSDNEWCWKFQKLINTDGLDLDLATAQDPWVKLDKIIRDVLPVEKIINETATDGKTFLETVLREDIIDRLLNLDVSKLLGTNSVTGILNIPANSTLRTEAMYPAVFRIVRELLNKVLGKVCGNTALIADSYNSLDAILKKEAIADLAEKLILGIAYAVKSGGLLDVALPFVNFFLGWTTNAQSYAEPKLTIDKGTLNYVQLTNGQMNTTLKVTNASAGMILKHGDTYDHPYVLTLKSVTVNGTEMLKSGEKKLSPYESTDVTLNAAVPTDSLVKVTAVYSFTFKDGTAYNGDITSTTFEYATNDATDVGTAWSKEDKKTNIYDVVKMKGETTTDYLVTNASALASAISNIAVTWTNQRDTDCKFTKGSISGFDSSIFESSGQAEALVSNSFNFPKESSISVNPLRVRSDVDIETVPSASSFALGNSSVTVYGKYRRQDGTLTMTAPFGTLYYYNGTNIKKVVDSEFKANRDSSKYPAEAWNTYWTALTAAAKLVYGPFRKANLGNYSDDNLTAAITALETAAKALDTANNESTTPSSGSATVTPAPIEDALKAAGDINYQNFDLYAYWAYEKAMKAGNAIIDAYKGPVAPEKYIDGSSLSEAEITAIANKANATYKSAIVASMKAPSTEAQNAYMDAVKAYKAPSYSELEILNSAKNIAWYASFLKGAAVKTEKQFLAKEIAAAKAQGYKEADYTAGSYARYTKALAAAEALNANANALQSEVFDVKYELEIAQRALMPKSASALEAGAYTELEAVIAQAKSIFTENSAYTFDASKADGLTETEAYAKLVSVLGYEYTDEKGNTANLYSGSAENYAANDRFYSNVVAAQIDAVITNLKNAMAPFVCKYVAVPTTAGSNEGVSVTENASLITGITPGSLATADDVLARVTAKDSSATTLNVAANAAGLYGTGATATLSLKSSGAPVAIYTVVIYGDVNGDGVVDGFDASSMDLAINNKTALTGAYKTAGGLATGKVDLANYGLVVDAAYGGTAIAQK